MGRMIAAVLVGYVVMFAIVFTTFSLAFLTMGSDRAFLPGSYDVSTLWIVISFLLGFLAALAGGWVCAAIARSRKGPQVLAGIALLLGLLMAIPVLTSKVEPKPRTGPVANLEAMQAAQTPAWIALVNPFLGAAGVLLGAGLRRDHRSV